jgi:choline dehydrogenase-like flavoprotein
VDNLYVVDASFFPSSSSVNPALTVMANALRVGDHLKERLGSAGQSTVMVSTMTKNTMAQPVVLS